METDSSLLPSALVFAGFLLLFSYLSLAEHSGTESNGSLNGRPKGNLRFGVTSFKYACVIAVTISGLALALSLRPLGWWPITILSLALLVVLTALDRSILAFTVKYPGKAKRGSAGLHRLLGGNGGRRATNGAANNGANGLGELDEEARLELEERVIAAADADSVDERDRQMLRSILRLDVSTVSEIMVPRLDMVTVDVEASVADVAGSMGQNGHGRLPVYEETTDNIVGIAHSRDLLVLLSRGEGQSSLRVAMRPALFVPETKKLDELLSEFQDKAIQMAIVVDEYGGTEGLVTMEDLLEEIVGEIEDEFSRVEEPEVVHLPNGSALVDAGITTDDVEELFDAELDSPDVDTLGGYVYRALGRIPQTGDVVITEHLRIEVISVLGRRLRKLRVDRAPDKKSATQTAG